MDKYSYIFLTTLSLIAVTLGLAWEKAIEAANVLVTAAMWAGVTALVILPLGLLATGLGLGGWFLSNRFIDNRQKRAEADLLAAQARQAARQADNLVITAAPGEQVFVIADADISHRSVSALHLQQSYRVNGSGDLPSPLESVAWALMQQLHSTANVPKTITHNSAAQLPAGENAEALLPERVDLLPLIGSEAPSLSRIIAGQTVSKGQLETVSLSLTEMVHVGIVGSSGWGKSLSVQSLALQLALAEDGPEMVFIDLEGVTSAPFQQLDRLRYPVAGREQDAVAILQDLKAEMERRVALFIPHRVQKLEQYNALPDVEALPCIVVIIDEATAILENNAAIHDLVAATVIQLRKSGVYLFLAGQEMGKDSMRPMIRRQLSSRIAFHVADHWQAQGLGIGKEAVQLNTKGRAWAIFPGRQKMKLQTPFIEATAIEGILAQRGRLGQAHRKMPEAMTESVPANEKPLTEKQRLIQEAIGNGIDEVSELARLAYGNDGGRQRELVRKTLKKLNPG